MRVCPHGIFVFFLVTGCISLSSHICMHLFVCARMGVRACVQICVYVYLCNVCVWGGWGGGGGGGRALCARSYTYMLLWMFAFINLFCFPVCVY